MKNQQIFFFFFLGFFFGGQTSIKVRHGQNLRFNLGICLDNDVIVTIMPVIIIITIIITTLTRIVNRVVVGR